MTTAMIVSHPQPAPAYRTNAGPLLYPNSMPFATILAG